MTSASPTSLQLPMLQDSATQNFASIPAYATSNCGALSYAMTSAQTWIIQDLDDELNFSIEVDEDPSLVGEHTLTVEVTSDDYSS